MLNLRYLPGYSYCTRVSITEIRYTVPGTQKYPVPVILKFKLKNVDQNLNHNHTEPFSLHTRKPGYGLPVLGRVLIHANRL